MKKSLNFNNAASSGSRPSSSLSDQLATSNETGRKRMQDEMFGSLSDDDELCGKSNVYYLMKLNSCKRLL